ncbi:hypothetical protein L1887_53918 [Cichorium endivia]|nr:hypothetical protein L1887_53918 [Cichorium endivia]
MTTTTATAPASLASTSEPWLATCRASPTDFAASSLPFARKPIRPHRWSRSRTSRSCSASAPRTRLLATSPPTPSSRSSSTSSAGPKPERHDLGSKSKIQAVDDEDDGLDDDMRAALATAAAADMEDSGEKMLLACRCLANLIEAMPYAAHGVVSHGAIPVLTSKLMEITFIDLAEQVLQTLEKVSQDYPGAIVREGGLSAILQYLDFFNIHIQRTAMTAAANCCRKLTPDSLASVRDVMPIVQNVLTYSDQRLVESACKCVVRVVDSYRLHPELLEQLLTGELLAALNNLLLPASSPSSSNTTLGASTYTDVLKALGTACRSSPQLAVALLENNIVETLYHLLTGSPAPRRFCVCRRQGRSHTASRHSARVGASFWPRQCG